MHEKEYVDDLESGNNTYGEKINYVAISPDGSIIATFNPYGSSISITKAATSDKAKICFDKDKFKKSSNIIGWSLAVSDIIDTENDTCLVAISCVTDKDTNPKETEKCGLSKFFQYFIKKKLSFWDSQLFLISLFILYYTISSFIATTLPPDFKPHFANLFFYLFFIIIPICILFFYENIYTHKILVTDNKQFRLCCTSNEGMINLFKFSFKYNNDNNDDVNNYSIFHLGGVVNFLKNSKNSSKNSATLICINCVKIRRINIRLDKNIFVSEEDTYLLPENLFEKLESFGDSRCNWNYLLKSNYQEYLMVDTSDHYKIYIELYDVNNLQLVNIFYRHREENCLISNNDEPGIFAISTDSRLFAYSNNDNIITLYLIENGLEVVSKKFDNINKIKFLEFIEKDKKLFIVEKDKGGDAKFHIWLMSGCLNDYFSISRDDICLSDSNIPSLSRYDIHNNTLTKSNGKVVLRNKDYEDQFEIISEITIKRTTFSENDIITDVHEYKSNDLEPWNNSIKNVYGRFLNNDRRLLLIIGQSSIQLWKSKSTNFVDFDDFKNFENSNLVYILISDKIKPGTKFLIEDDMTTVIIHACKSLTYLYKHANRTNNSRENYQRFVGGIVNIIKDFIKRYPDNWKIMEVQYPLMAYLIYSRSFSLIKYILFDVNDQSAEKLHKPQNKYFSYSSRYDLELYDDLELKDENSNPANDLELALKFCQEQDAVMLGYLLEYYSENSMNHIGWMINVTKILPELSELSNYGYYVHKPCFGGMKYNFPIKRFRALSVCEDTLKVYMPLTKLLSINSSDFFLYNKIREDISSDTYMVPLPNFTTHDEKIEIKKGIIYFLRKTLFPPSYKNLEDENFSPFLQIKKNGKTFFSIPAIEATINSRWYHAMAYWIRPLGLYAMFLILFTTIPQYPSIGENNTINVVLQTFLYIGVGIFYYIGLYLLMIEFMQIRKYKRDYFTIFDIFDLGIGFADSITYLPISDLSPDDPGYPFTTIWKSILSMYYMNIDSLNDKSDNSSFKLFVFIANLTIVLVLFNMVIAYMNGAFEKAKNDGNHGLLKYRKELIDDFERLNISFNNPKLYETPYICYLHEPELMKKWKQKSQELRETKLYSWFRESSDKENITYDDGVDITTWYELISSNENQDSL
ncbi:hypothetical protein RclHR1_04550006 [Rhizophagus clarus]|uniref:Ion transport domain-containing protein n=1 Tax=Rhizophagus clarus TaxID=94130 RepID=A0A2Z6SCA2_9GLOM|nr:hypothetical protein RclHR1_04550006 [Rhizophagus clarus]